MNKRASLADSIFVPLYILLIACTIFIAYYVWISFVDVFNPIATNVLLPDGRNLTAVMSNITVSIGYLDYMFPFLVLGLLIVSLIFAFRTGASVIYSYVSVFFWVLALMMSVVFQNIFEAFSANFASISPTLAMVSFIVSNIKWLSLAWAFLISIVMFTRTQQDNQQLASAERAFG